MRSIIEASWASYKKNLNKMKWNENRISSILVGWLDGCWPGKRKTSIPTVKHSSTHSHTQFLPFSWDVRSAAPAAALAFYYYAATTSSIVYRLRERLDVLLTTTPSLHLKSMKSNWKRINCTVRKMVPLVRPLSHFNLGHEFVNLSRPDLAGSVFLGTWNLPRKIWKKRKENSFLYWI